MKRKITTYLFASAVLAAVAAGGIQVIGQSGRDQNRPQNSGQYGQIPTGSPSAQLYTTLMRNSAGEPAFQVQGWQGHGPQRFTFVNKDGATERIEKEPGVQLSKEEFDQVNETRQRIQNAVSQLRSQDVDESKRKDAKEFISKYLKAEFQADQESRREQVERLEEQIEQLKKQLSKREESQDKLIELRMQLLENDASGLSFPDAWGNLSGPPANRHYAPPYATSPGMTPSASQYQNYQYPSPQVFTVPVPPDAANVRARY